MGMFDALIPQNADADFGTESYEEIVDSYCMALEDVEAEIAGLESLSDAIDNAEAFAAAIESCGEQVSPALMQFGYSVDPSFGQLIGRECPSDFATEDMQEFDSFALESIKSKLVVAWEAVKTFIVKMWEKIKEFCRMVLRLFDRKKQRLEAIVKKCNDRTAKGGDKANIRKPDKKKIVSLSKSEMETFITAAATAYKSSSDWIVEKGDVAFDINGAVCKALEIVGWQKFTNGGFSDIAKKSMGKKTEKDFSALGFNTFKDIASIAQGIIDLMDMRADVEKGIKLVEKCKAKAESYGNMVKKFDDPADKDLDKKDKDEIREADKLKAKALAVVRRRTILSSKLVVAFNKEVNNCAASVIQIAGIAGI